MSNQEKRRLTKTKKLRGAVSILAGERYCDCWEGELYMAIALGLLTYHGVYFGLDRMGYSWNRRDGVWWQRIPVWVTGWQSNPHFEEARLLGQEGWINE